MAGCSRSPTSIAAPTVSASPRPSSTSTATPAPTPKPTHTPLSSATPPKAVPTPISGGRYGGTLQLASRQTISHLDVHQEVSPSLATWGPGIVYSRLMRFRTGEDVELPSLEVVCELCESWEMEDDRIFVFRLRRDIRWQDIPPVNGRLLTAEDIVYSYNRQRRAGWPNAPLLSNIETIEAPRPGTVRITLSAPDADFLIALADGHSKIVAKEAVEVSGDLTDGPVIGTGPWILSDDRRGSSFKFVRNPDYFEDALPFVDQLIIRTTTDSATRDAAFKLGAIDVQQMGPEEWERFRQSRPGAPVLMFKDAGTGLEVALNTSVPPFDDVRIRQAVFQAMDPWSAIEDIWLGGAFVSLGFPVVRGDWLLEDGEMREFFGQPELARQTIREAGKTVPLPVTIKVGDFGDLYSAHAERIADEMRAVGFEPAIELVDRRAFGQEVWLGGDYQMMVGPNAPVSSPNGYLLPVLHSRGRWNTTRHQDAELDRLIEAQAQEYDPDVRRELVRRIQLRVLEQAYRVMPATRVAIWTWWPRLHNFYPNFAGSEYSHWARIWVAE